MTTSSDRTEPNEAEFLQQAVRLALGNVSAGQPPFGALVVRDGHVLATGVNTTGRDGDPTAHAEVAAVRVACLELQTLDLTGATMVSSCEPCAMCHAVCAVAGITEIIYAAPKEFVPDLGRTPRPDLVEMQTALRRLAGEAVRYVRTPGAEEPFTRLAEMTGGR